MRCQGYVTVLQINGNWQLQLRSLSGDHKLSGRTVRQVVNFVEQRPLHKKCEAYPGWNEHGPEYPGDGFVLYYTNHHWFPVVWLIRRTTEFTTSKAVLDHDALQGFYSQGLECYRSEEQNGLGVFRTISARTQIFCGALPTSWRAIEVSMPDKLLSEFF